MNSEHVDINSYFIEFMKMNPLTFIFYFLLMFMYPLHKVVLPKYYGKVISSLKNKINMSSNNEFVKNIISLLSIYVVIQIMYSVMYKVQGYFIPNFSEFSIINIFSSLLQNNNLDYENLETGEILSKIIKVPNLIYEYLNLLRSFLFSQLIVIITCMFHFFGISNSLGLSFCFLVFGLFVLQYISYVLTLDIEVKREQEKDNIYQHFQDVLNNLISVVVCKQEKHEKDVLHKQYIPYIDVFTKSLNLNFIIRIIFSLFNVFSFILLNYMLYKEYMNNSINKEQMISSFIVAYSILSIFNEGYYGVRSIVDMYSQIKDMELYFNEKNKASTNIKPCHEKTYIQKKYTHGDIVFKNISYMYKGNKVKNEKGEIEINEKESSFSFALKDVDLVIKKNENVAIVGQIGSGKSTLVKLLLKLTMPNEGNITIGNVDLHNLSREELYNHVFYVPQKPKLMDRTLYENIIYGLEETTMKKSKKENIENINKIMKQMNLDKHIIQIFNDKMDTNMGIDGVKLSGGQRQMVWIIRAMLRNPKLLILDEPSASLDPKNKNLIMKTIQDIGQDKTIIIITHDNIQGNFRKIIMNQGQVVQNKENNYNDGLYSWF